jgi:hypothetical protein
MSPARRQLKSLIAEIRREDITLDQASDAILTRWEDDDHALGSRLIKSTIQEQRRGKQRPGNFALACRSGLQCA